jgi:hypothetical protein
VPPLFLALLLQGNISPFHNMEARLLAAHNRVRAEAGVPPLTWDPALAEDAEIWAGELTRLGWLVHSPDSPRDPDPQGENLWAGTRGYYGPEAMVGLWAREKRNFRPGIFPINSRTGRLEDVGHYTQLIWRTTKRVGCAFAHGRRDDFLVCRYREGGNVIGERPV